MKSKDLLKIAKKYMPHKQGRPRLYVTKFGEDALLALGEAWLNGEVSGAQCTRALGMASNNQHAAVYVCVTAIQRAVVSKKRKLVK